MTNYYHLSCIHINELKENWIQLGIKPRPFTCWVKTLPLGHQIALETRALIDGLRGGWASGLSGKALTWHARDNPGLIPGWIQFSFSLLINLFRWQIIIICHYVHMLRRISPLQFIFHIHNKYINNVYDS